MYCKISPKRIFVKLFTEIELDQSSLVTVIWTMFHTIFLTPVSLWRTLISERMHTWSRHYTVTLIGCNAKGEGYNEHRPRKKVHPSYLLQRVTFAGRCPRPPHSHMRGYKERAAPYGFPWETSHRPIDPICYMTFFILSLLILFFNLMQLPSENSHTS